MKTRIDYYLIPETTEREKRTFACRLIEKAFSQHHHLYIHTASAAEANLFNDLLWTFRDISFLPHSMIGEKPAPIQIGFETPSLEQYDILINLNSSVPPFFSRFERIIEIVPDDPELQKQSRVHYRYYKDQDCTINTHDLRKTRKP